MAVSGAGEHWFLKADPWSDRPRYYPPGQHPALERDRRMIARVRRFIDEVRRREVECMLVPGEIDLNDAYRVIEYYEQRIAAFEEAESERKAHDAALLRG